MALLHHFPFCYFWQYPLLTILHESEVQTTTRKYLCQQIEVQISIAKHLPSIGFVL